MLGALTTISFAAVVYAYLGYPLLLWLLLQARRQRRATPPAAARALPSLTIIITIRNEAPVLREKLESTLALRYGERSVAEHLTSGSRQLQLIVASDASDDESDAITGEYAARGVELVRLPRRGGKERAQREALQYATGSIIVFTDAKIRLEDDVLSRFAAYFDNPEIGAVSSVDRVEAVDGEASGEGFYVRYEMWLRALESDFKTLIGLSGSCFAVRRQVCDAMATDIPSDFALLLQAQKLGLRGVHAPDVVAVYRPVRSEKEEFSRKVRTVLRGMRAFSAHIEVVRPDLFGTFSWMILSHKLARWLVPWFFLTGTAGALLLAADSWFWALCTAGVGVLVLLAVLGALRPELQRLRPIKIPLFFFVANAAVLIAGIRFLSGGQAVTWDPSAKRT